MRFRAVDFCPYHTLRIRSRLCRTVRYRERRRSQQPPVRRRASRMDPNYSEWLMVSDNDGLVTVTRLPDSPLGQGAHKSNNRRLEISL